MDGRSTQWSSQKKSTQSASLPLEIQDIPAWNPPGSWSLNVLSQKPVGKRQTWTKPPTWVLHDFACFVMASAKLTWVVIDCHPQTTSTWFVVLVFCYVDQLSSSLRRLPSVPQSWSFSRRHGAALVLVLKRSIHWIDPFKGRSNNKHIRANDFTNPFVLAPSPCFFNTWSNNHKPIVNGLEGRDSKEVKSSPEDQNTNPKHPEINEPWGVNISFPPKTWATDLLVGFDPPDLLGFDPRKAQLS